jgi:hypothetical protein
MKRSAKSLLYTSRSAGKYSTSIEERTMSVQFGVIKKMAQILGAIETYIYKNNDHLPKQRSRFIDECTIGLSEFEDDFFTYDQLKNLVVNMVNQCESSSSGL